MPQLNYVAPSTDSIAAAQDSLPALQLQIAQRRLYSQAKFWSFLRWLGFSVIGVVAPLIAVFAPSAAVLMGAFAGVWIFVSRTLFVGLESTRAAKAAAVQEDFDCLVFGMPMLAARVPRATPEEIATVVGSASATSAVAAEEKLIGWYPLDRDLNGTASVAIAQRASAAYSERLQQLNAKCWLGVLTVWAVAAVALSLIADVGLPTFLLGVVAPLLPAFLDVTDQWKAARRAGADRRSMADDIESAIRGTSANPLSGDDLMVWQERLYTLRRSSPLVPNLVYKRARDRNERVMNAAADELSAAAKQLQPPSY
ncbi:MAG: S-4TM family putative pore-forming effector [Mycobacterium sp.]